MSADLGLRLSDKNIYAVFAGAVRIFRVRFKTEIAAGVANGFIRFKEVLHVRFDLSLSGVGSSVERSCPMAVAGIQR